MDKNLTIELINSLKDIDVTLTHIWFVLLIFVGLFAWFFFTK